MDSAGVGRRSACTADAVAAYPQAQEGQLNPQGNDKHMSFMEHIAAKPQCPLGEAASCLMFMASVLLTAACLLVSVAQPAFADDLIDQTRIGSLSLTCEYDHSPIANLPFSLWYVASVDESGSYKLAPEFADCSADLNALSLSTEWDATAKNIISWLG